MTIQGRNKLKPQIITIMILTGLIFLVTILAGYPRAIEDYYSQGVYPYICIVLHSIFNIFPFSVGDVVYLLMIAALICTALKLFRQLFKRQFKKSLQTLLGMVIGIQAAIVIFYLFWGMNYFRPPAAERLKLQDTVYSLTELKAITALMIDSANATRARLQHADIKVDNDSIYHIAIAAVDTLSKTSANFRTYYPKVKPSLLTGVTNYLGTSGYYNPFTGEAQVNYRMPVFIRPFVACHELSHQMGFGPEDEANFAGFVAGVGSKDRLLRYSAYYSGMTEFMYALRSADSLEFKRYKKRISKNVLADLKAERTYWQYYAGRVEVVSSLFYDSYLKANNQPQGLMTYNQMITLVMAWYREKR
ncbi:MAG: DUF3810 domain-containing protein [Sphingobacteriaceae bacterium]|nr:MAG: DUF3810 domain-containing protein [Sphingobacteriaceae bacterium]